MKLRSEIQAVYNKAYGEPSDITKFDAEGNSVEILRWDMDRWGLEISLYATLGASSILRSYPHSVERHCEFLMRVTPSVTGLDSFLTDLCVFGDGSRQVPGCGDTFSYRNDSLWEGNSLCGVLFSDFENEEIDSSIDDLAFIELVPLFGNEIEFKLAHGHEELISVFSQYEVPFWESDRAPFEFLHH